MGLRELMTRASVPKAGLGNLLVSPGGGGAKGKVTAATQAVTYVSEGQPLNVDWNGEEMARQGYLGSVYVMRCVRLIAETIGSLPWVSGVDPTDPGNYDKDSALAMLLGPSTPQAPGGPNPVTPARVFWIWTLCQYLITGRFGWECQLDGAGKKANIIGLWPLVASVLAPKPTLGGTKWFNGYRYTPANGDRDLKDEQVIYGWRPSQTDFRMPESVLQSAQVSIFIARSIDKYVANLLKNDLVATSIVTTPPFDIPDEKRAFEEQFLSEFSGVDRAGGTVFAEYEATPGDPAGYKPIQVERLAMSVMEAELGAQGETAKNEVCLALGVPRSLIGDASQRTYANADSEYKNFWTLTVLNFIAEMQDNVNYSLSPRLGEEVGWFDLSRVAALQPPSQFAPPSIADVISTGVANAAQIANVLGIPAANSTGDSDTDTVEIGEESSTPSPMGAKSADMSDMELRAMYDRDNRIREQRIRRAQEAGNRAVELAVRHPEMLRWLEEADRRKHAPVNTHTLKGLRKPWQPMEREVIHVTTAPTQMRAISTSGPGIDQAKMLTRQAKEIRALAVASRTAKTVHTELAKTYPESTLGWVDDAEWDGPKKVKLADIDMDKRPGGRDQAKVAGIAKALAMDPTGPAGAAVILVKTPDSEKLKVADGYHRTLAHKRLEHGKVPAYVATVADESGPWDKDMHDAKMNRSLEVLETRGFDGWADEFEGNLEALVNA